MLPRYWTKLVYLSGTFFDADDCQRRVILFCHPAIDLGCGCYGTYYQGQKIIVRSN